MADQNLRFGLSLSKIKYRSQLVAYPFFAFSALLFLFQIIFGLIMASQYVWPNFLIDSLPFNIGRETHLNLLIFWLLLGLMGASYYLIPEETESEIFSPLLAYVQLGILVTAGVGTLLSFWFLRWSEGKPFTESPLPWPWFIAVGVVLFIVNIGLTIYRAHRWTAISTVLFIGMAGLAVMYLVNFGFKPNLTVDYFWWWWTIHLWVEGAWELIAAAVLAFVLFSMTGVPRTLLNKYLYAEVALTLFTGIIGTGHHYYWIGTPDYWLTWGAVFSAFEPVPIALMAYDALTHLRHRQKPVVNRVAWFWVGGSAIGHLAGAGVWGFAQTLPQINQWTHGTQITASHGHFAFFGAFATLVLAAIYFMLPKMKGIDRFVDLRAIWAFWLMIVGMIIMVLSFATAGIVQVYLNRVVGLDFMTVRVNYVSFWMFWVFVAGALLFLPGVVIYVWDFFFGMHPATDEDQVLTST